MMKKPRVIILGSTGMLGSVTVDSFVKSGDFELIATCRNKKEAASFIRKYPNVEFRILDAEKADVKKIAKVIEGADWVVNAIGIIKPYIKDDNAAETKRATKVNALFPHLLGEAAEATGAKVLQIATDCVYSGEKGKYTESDAHDALDVYGKSKSLGEASMDAIHHIRCSIVGPERKAHLSLMDWFLNQKKHAELNGFANHQWNGVTTLHFARLCQGIIKSGIKLPHIQHIIPGNIITKANLLKAFAARFGRDDVKINEVEAPKVIDRTLATNDDSLNTKIWKAAGYDTPPTVEKMVEELADYQLTT